MRSALASPRWALVFGLACPACTTLIGLTDVPSEEGPPDASPSTAQDAAATGVEGGSGAGDSTVPGDGPAPADGSAAIDTGLDAPGDRTPPADSGTPDATGDTALPPTSGTLDSNFGRNGIFVMPSNLTFPSAVDRVAIDGNGRILYSGRASCNGQNFAFVGRLLTTGAPDTTFDADGGEGYTAGCTSEYTLGALWLSTDAPGSSMYNGDVWASPLATGDIAVAGVAQAPDSNDVIFASRYTSDGARLNSFGTNGIDVVTSDTGSSYAYDVLVAGGDMLVGGTVNKAPLLVSLSTAGGALNPSFGQTAADGGAGVATFPSYGTMVTSLAHLPANGDVLVAVGGSTTTLGLAVSATTGQIDAAHFDGGVFGAGASSFTVATDSAATSAAVALPDGSFAFVGTTVGSGGARIQIVHFLSNGALDTSYGTSGVAQPSPLDATASNAVAASDGKLLVSALVTGGNPVVIRVASNGSLDPTFAPGVGYAPLPLLPGSNNQSSRVPLVLDAMGRILVAGLIFTPPPGTGCCDNATVEIARFVP